MHATWTQLAMRKIAVFCLIAVSPSFVVGQESRASIAGLVTDSRGGGVPAARVVVTSVERNTVSETLTTGAESASRSQVITTKKLHDLPNNGRSVFQMVWAAMGVRRTTNSW